MPVMRNRVLLASLTLLLVGCGARPNPNDGPTATPFVFQALNLRQQNARGQMLWRISSPEARYDLSRRLALARQLQGEIFSNGNLQYRLQASHGTVLNDGEVVQLEGDVRVQRMGTDPVIIRAARMRWYPRQQRIALDRRAMASTQDLRLSATQATLLLDRDRLELRGQPTLRSADLTLRLQQLDWSPGSGQMTAAGPVLATATPSTANGPARTLRAASLSGNSRSRSLDLRAPVTVTAPDQNAWLRAQSTRFDVQRNTLASSSPFTAAFGNLSLQGGGFNIDLSSSRGTVLQGCRLQQPGAALRAGSCSWDWRRNRVSAAGGVELERRSPQQLTRAEQLSGRLGDQGVVVFSSPGSKVRSNLRLPAARRAEQRPAAAIRL